MLNRPHIFGKLFDSPAPWSILGMDMSLDNLQRGWELLQEAYQAQMEGDYARAVELYENSI